MKKTPTKPDFLQKKSLKKLLSVLLCFMVLTSFTINRANANNNKLLQSPKRDITGTVVSASDGSPIPGANVFIKNTTVGTITDINGNFNIQASNEDIIVVSFIGFISREILVSDQSKFEVRLEEDVAELDEVVVIGYGIQKKKLVTGATSQVKGEELEKRSTLHALQAMQGQAAGINLTSTSGQPGEDIKVVIRGIGTIDNEGPLYIVDGIPTGDKGP